MTFYRRSKIRWQKIPGGITRACTVWRWRYMPNLSLIRRLRIPGGIGRQLTGKQVIGLYLGKTSFGSTYGAAGSLVIVLVWVYYSAQLFFLGAEFTKVYTKTFGSQFARQFERVPPKPDNVIIDPSTDEPTTGSNGEITVNLV